MKQLLLLSLMGTLIACDCGDEPAQTTAQNCPDTVYITTSDFKIDTTNLAENEFLMPDGDTFYVMKQYFMCFLDAVEGRDDQNLDSAKIAQIQAAHLSHMDSLAQLGKIDVAGPFGDDQSTRGIVIYNVATLEEAEGYANNDPAVRAGRLAVRVRPWWGAKGTRLK